MSQQPTTNNQQLITNNKQPTVEAFVLCYNEEKFIKHTLNHYSQFCNKISIIDNCSTDNTAKIVEQYMQTPVNNCNYEFIQYGSNNQIRDDYYLHLKNSVWKNSKADYVIVCDMDELLYHTNIKEVLLLCHKNNVALPLVQGYNMYSETFPDNYDLPITTQAVRGVRATNFDKQIIFSPKFVDEILFFLGAHGCNPIFIKGYVPSKSTEALKLLHYKYIGYDYLLEKHSQYAARLSDYNKKNMFGAEYLKGEKHIKECFDQLRKTNLLKNITI